MLDWILKYKVRVPGAPQKQASSTGEAASASPAAADNNRKPATQASGKARKVEATAPHVDWAAQLQAAGNDDLALLALAQQAGAPLATKLAAVNAITSEAVLKDAERGFRSHDRRVHSLAKQRVQNLRLQRETRAKADQLIQAAQALCNEAVIPVNSAVELDRAWSALDAEQLLAEQKAAYDALTTRLSELTRQRADDEAAAKLWKDQARLTQAFLKELCIQAAQGDIDSALLASTSTQVHELFNQAPTGADTQALGEQLARAQALSERLVLLEAVINEETQPAPPAAAVPAEPPLAAEAASSQDGPADIRSGTNSESPTEGSAVPQPSPATAAPPRPLALYKQLPPMADAELAGLLQARLDTWHHSRQEARQQAKAQRKEQHKQQQRAERGEKGQVLEQVLTQAEARLAEGLVAETHKHLLEIDELLHAGAAAEALRVRIAQLQEAYAELRGWQHWAGGRARDDLTQEAEALARASAATPEGQPAKIQFKAHSDHIDQLRARWKELDRLGGASSRALWQRFDAALKAAYEPLAAIKANQSAAREQNLAARIALLNELEAVPLAVGEATHAPDLAVTTLRPVLSALDHFRTEWRKLGPVEHTVPRKAQQALHQRMEAAVQRLHAPVDDARQKTQQERLALIARAQELAHFAQQASSAPAGPGPRGGGRDLVAEVRQLQGQWQESAQALPLPRKVEAELWTQFRSALDAVFSAREAAYSARDAEFKSHAEARETLIAQLQAQLEAPTEKLARSLHELDTQWQRCGPAPRHQAQALEDRWRKAREAAAQWVAGSKQRAWQAQCDTLQTKLALCEALESGATNPDALTQAWGELPPMPAAWETPLKERAGLAPATTSPGANLPDAELLLQLEAAWNLASPTELAHARRDLQLQAMKAALEGNRRQRSGGPASPSTPEQWLQAALRRAWVDPAHHQRLLTVLQALRRKA